MSIEGAREFSTRATHNRRRGAAKSAVAVAVILVLVAAVTMMASSFAHSATTQPLELSSAPDTTASLAPVGVAHDIAIETVVPGREGLELSARLTEDGGLIEMPLDWTIKTAAGEPVYTATTSIADATIRPGDYQIDVRYGAIHLVQKVALVDGTRLIMSFVLNAGGIRILPKLQGLGAPAVASQSRIFALSGPTKGKLVATSSQPGEILRVPAGEYRIESHFDRGNASAVTDVTVKPGMMNAVEIAHAAGLARLSFVGAPTANVEWRLADANGNVLAPIEGLAAEVVLVPGTYTAVAQIGSETMTANFVISAGESRDIILGN